MAAMKDHLEDLLEDYTYYKAQKDKAYEQGRKAMFVSATAQISYIRTQLTNLGYDVRELAF
jgi:hypothetical protein